MTDRQLCSSAERQREGQLSTQALAQANRGDPESVEKRPVGGTRSPQRAAARTGPAAERRRTCKWVDAGGVFISQAVSPT